MANLEPVLGSDDTIRRNFSKVEDLYTSRTDFETRIAVLEAALDGNRVVAGTVTLAGAVNTGVGFSASKTATGTYSVTFTTAFSVTPAATVTALTSSLRHGIITASTTSSITVVMLNSSTGAATDTAFAFVAVAPA